MQKARPAEPASKNRAARKTPSAKRAKAVAPETPPSGMLTGAPAPKSPLTARERHRMTAEAAYYRAERRDFAPGEELRDWLEAEEQLRAAKFGLS